MTDPYDLDRFVQAQAAVFPTVRQELLDGQKRTHWMWFIFPQLIGLGTSAMARRYALTSLAEATAYLAHPVLGPRLLDCTTLVTRITDRSVHQIFGLPDDMKFHSCMTLFSAARPGPSACKNALDQCFDGKLDQMTIERLQRLSNHP